MNILCTLLFFLLFLVILLSCEMINDSNATPTFFPITSIYKLHTRKSTFFLNPLRCNVRADNKWATTLILEKSNAAFCARYNVQRTIGIKGSRKKTTQGQIVYFKAYFPLSLCSLNSCAVLSLSQTIIFAELHATYSLPYRSLCFSWKTTVTRDGNDTSMFLEYHRYLEINTIEIVDVSRSIVSKLKGGGSSFRTLKVHWNSLR